MMMQGHDDMKHRQPLAEVNSPMICSGQCQGRYCPQKTPANCSSPQSSSGSTEFFTPNSGESDGLGNIVQKSAFPSREADEINVCDTPQSICKSPDERDSSPQLAFTRDTGPSKTRRCAILREAEEVIGTDEEFEEDSTSDEDEQESNSADTVCRQLGNDLENETDTDQEGYDASSNNVDNSKEVSDSDVTNQEGDYGSEDEEAFGKFQNHKNPPKREHLTRLDSCTGDAEERTQNRDMRGIRNTSSFKINSGKTKIIKEDLNENESKTNCNDSVSDQECFMTPAVPSRRRRLKTRAQKEKEQHTAGQFQRNSSKTPSDEEDAGNNTTFNLTTIKKTIKSTNWKTAKRHHHTPECGEDLDDFIVDDECESENDSINSPIEEVELARRFDTISLINDDNNSTEGGSDDDVVLISEDDSEISEEETSVKATKAHYHDASPHEDKLQYDDIKHVLEANGYNWRTMHDRFPKRKAKKLREVLAKSFYDIFNENVFEGKLLKDFNSAVQWSNRLRTTAGLTYTRTRIGAFIKNDFNIHLSIKVLDRPYRVACTLLHEMCHAAAWVINGNRKPPHGAIWKSWANKASARFPVFSVSRLHTYEIHYKFNYICQNTKCRFTEGRHSKSVDTEKQACPLCGGRLELQEPEASESSDKEQNLNPFSVFVKKHYNKVKQGTIGTKLCQNLENQFSGTPRTIPHNQVMHELSEMWRLQKENGSISVE